jgi:hypothetical protein
VDDQPSWQMAPRFREADFVRRPAPTPRLGLSVLKAARAYAAALTAAAAGRDRLIATAARRGGCAGDTLAALNVLADSFDLPQFTAAEVP